MLTPKGKYLLHRYRSITGNEMTPKEFLEHLKICDCREGICRTCENKGKLRDGLFCEECIGESIQAAAE